MKIMNKDMESDSMVKKIAKVENRVGLLKMEKRAMI